MEGNPYTDCEKYLLPTTYYELRIQKKARKENQRQKRAIERSNSLRLFLIFAAIAVFLGFGAEIVLFLFSIVSSNPLVQMLIGIVVLGIYFNGDR